MGGGESTTRIVRTWHDNSCATGEQKYETADGRVWKTCWATPVVTGAVYADVEGDRMRPRR